MKKNIIIQKKTFYSQLRDFSSKLTPMNVMFKIRVGFFKFVDRLFDMINPDHTKYEMKSRNQINRLGEQEYVGNITRYNGGLFGCS